MRKALLADETVAKIAENPKKMAFLRAIEDRDGDDELDLDFLEESQGIVDGSQSQSQSQGAEAAAQSYGEDELSEQSKKRKRPFEASGETGNRLAPNLRRSAPGKTKRPATIAEVRESVSFLIEDPHAIINTSADASSEDEADNEKAEMGDLPDDADDDERGPSFDLDDNDPVFKKPLLPRQSFSERRTKPTKGKVIDRLSLLRQASSSSASTSGQTKLAFERASSDIPGFKVPSLLRRATTNSSFSSESSSTTGVTERRDDKGIVRKSVGAGGKKSSINYYAASREKERERQLKRGKNDGKKMLVTVSGVGRSALGGIVKRDSWE